MPSDFGSTARGLGKPKSKKKTRPVQKTTRGPQGLPTQATSRQRPVTKAPKAAGSSQKPAAKQGTTNHRGAVGRGADTTTGPVKATVRVRTGKRKKDGRAETRPVVRTFKNADAWKAHQRRRELAKQVREQARQDASQPKSQEDENRLLAKGKSSKTPSKAENLAAEAKARSAARRQKLTDDVQLRTTGTTRSVAKKGYDKAARRELERQDPDLARAGKDLDERTQTRVAERVLQRKDEGNYTDRERDQLKATVDQAAAGARKERERTDSWDDVPGNLVKDVKDAVSNPLPILKQLANQGVDETAKQIVDSSPARGVIAAGVKVAKGDGKGAKRELADAKKDIVTHPLSAVDLVPIAGAAGRAVGAGKTMIRHKTVDKTIRQLEQRKARQRPDLVVQTRGGRDGEKIRVRRQYSADPVVRTTQKAIDKARGEKAHTRTAKRASRLSPRKADRVAAKHIGLDVGSVKNASLHREQDADLGITARERRDVASRDQEQQLRRRERKEAKRHKDPGFTTLVTELYHGGLDPEDTMPIRAQLDRRISTLKRERERLDEDGKKGADVTLALLEKARAAADVGTVREAAAIAKRRVELSKDQDARQRELRGLDDKGDRLRVTLQHHLATGKIVHRDKGEKLPAGEHLPVEPDTTMSPARAKAEAEALILTERARDLAAWHESKYGAAERQARRIEQLEGREHTKWETGTVHGREGDRVDEARHAARFDKAAMREAIAHRAKVDELEAKAAAARAAAAKAAQGGQAPRALEAVERVATTGGFYDTRTGQRVKPEDLPDVSDRFGFLRYQDGDGSDDRNVGSSDVADGFTGRHLFGADLAERGPRATQLGTERALGVARLARAVLSHAVGSSSRGTLDAETARKVAKAESEKSGIPWSAVPVGQVPVGVLQASDAAARRRRGDDGQDYVAMPKFVADTWDAQVAESGRTLALGQAGTRAFVRAVLPLSAAWHVGNAADLMARLALSGWRPRDARQADVLREQLHDLHPDLAGIIIDSMVGHVGSRQTVEKRGVRDVVHSGRDPVPAGHDTDGRSRSRKSPTPRDGKRTRIGESLERKAQPVSAAYQATLGRLVDKGFDLGNDLETRMVRAAQGTAARQLAKDYALAAGDLQQLARKLASDPHARRDFQQRTLQITGDYLTRSPKERGWLHVASPFFQWIRAANRFVYATLPGKHPYKVSLYLMAARASEEDRRLLGMSDWITENEARELGYPDPKNGYFAGALDGVGDGWLLPTGFLTSFGEAARWTEPINAAGDAILPQVSRTAAAAQGHRGSEGRYRLRQLLEQTGVDDNALQGQHMAQDPEGIARAALGSTVPGARLAGDIALGGSATTAGGQLEDALGAEQLPLPLEVLTRVSGGIGPATPYPDRETNRPVEPVEGVIEHQVGDVVWEYDPVTHRWSKAGRGMGPGVHRRARAGTPPAERRGKALDRLLRDVETIRKPTPPKR